MGNAGEYLLYETQAITRYIDEVFEGPRLQPSEPKSRARMAQVMSIVDAYVYWPMVRQVFSQRMFAPFLGEAADEAEITAGLEASARPLSALEALLRNGAPLGGSQVTLADLHLAPMMAYFAATPEGQAQLQRYPGLNAWWAEMSELQSLRDTDELSR